MKRKASALLIGSFVVAGLALLAVVLIALAGNNLFARKQSVVMHFTGSVYGLQVGAPVVFRGVRVGSVVSVEVFYDAASDSFSIPVVAELEGDAVQDLNGRGADDEPTLALPRLVQRGLTAQLSMQSLLTGLLYVDLDLRPKRASSVAGNHRSHRDLIEIPTSATAIQALKTQFESMDFRRVVDDLSAIAASARAVVAGPELKRALADLSDITANVKHLSGRLDQRVDPVVDDLQRSLAAVRQAVQQIGTAAQGVGATARSITTTSDRAGALLAPDAPLVRNLQHAADEVAKSAASLRQTTSGDGTLVRSSERALQDLSNAARALRDLAEALQQQPEALLRGRKDPP